MMILRLAYAEGGLVRPMSKKIIFDVDDVLWPLTDSVFDRSSIPCCHGDFHIQSTDLTLDQQAKILAGFQDPENFKNIEFYAGAKDITRPMQLGYEIQINSNSYNEEIREHKRRQLLEFIPELTEHNLQLSLISESKDHSHLKQKRVGSDVLIFVDDSPYNIGSSRAKINIIPRKPWNINHKARATATDNHPKVKIFENWRAHLPEIALAKAKTIVYADGLSEINQLIWRIINFKNQEESNGKS